MNICIDPEYKKRYCFEAEDLIGNIFYIYKKRGIYENKISYDLMEKFICILAEKFTEKEIKTEFVLSSTNITRFLNDNETSFEESTLGKKGIIKTQYFTLSELAQKYHSKIPSNILEVLLDEEVHNNLIEAYQEERKEKLLVKKRLNN